MRLRTSLFLLSLIPVLACKAVMYRTLFSGGELGWNFLLTYLASLGVACVLGLAVQRKHRYGSYGF